MADTVQYILQLKDELSAQLSVIEKNTSRMNNTMRESGNVVRGLQTAFLQFFAVTKIVQFGRDSFDAFMKIEHAETQINVALADMHGRLRLTKQDLTEQQEAWVRTGIFSREQIAAMQLDLLKFRSLNTNSFQEIEKVSMEIAARTGESLTEISDTVARSLNNPQRGIMLLSRQYGLFFTEVQRKQIETMYQTGHVAQAQALLIKMLGENYKGSMEAALGTTEGRLKQLANQLEEVKEKVGLLIADGLNKMMPYLRQFIDYTEKHILPALREWAKDLLVIARWVKENWNWIKPIAEMALAFVALQKALAIAREAQIAFNLVVEANPYLLVASAIAVLLVQIYKLREANAEFSKNRQEAAGNEEKSYLNEQLDKIKAVNKVWDEQKEKIERAAIANQELATIENERQKALKLWASGNYDEAKLQMDALKARKEFVTTWATAPTDKTGGKAGKAEGVESMGLEPEKVSGQKMTNINITMKNLIEHFNISTTNLQESTGKIREEVLKVLVGAVNDAQILVAE